MNRYDLMARLAAGTAYHTEKFGRWGEERAALDVLGMRPNLPFRPNHPVILAPVVTADPYEPVLASAHPRAEVEIIQIDEPAAPVLIGPVVTDNPYEAIVATAWPGAQVQIEWVE